MLLVITSVLMVMLVSVMRIILGSIDISDKVTINVDRLLRKRGVVMLFFLPLGIVIIGIIVAEMILDLLIKPMLYYGLY